MLHGENQSSFQRPLEDFNECPKEKRIDIVPYIFDYQKDPAPVEGFSDIQVFSKVDQALKVNILWSLLDALPDAELTPEELPINLIGSWTPFQKLVHEKQVEKSIIEYQPMIAAGPSPPVCAAYMDSLLSVISDLELDHIFTHADEDILSKLLKIKWNDPEKYGKIEPFAGGFHFIRVIHAILYKRYSFIGLKDWFIQCGVIAEGSAEKAVKGKGNSYYRCNRLHKTGFCAISQLLVEKSTADYNTMDETLLSAMKTLKKALPGVSSDNH